MDSWAAVSPGGGRVNGCCTRLVDTWGKLPIDEGGCRAVLLAARRWKSQSTFRIPIYLYISKSCVKDLNISELASSKGAWTSHF